MTGIGMNFASEPLREANIEDTLYFASVEGMEKNDLRTLSVLVTWLGEHIRWVNADRLYRVVSCSNSTRVRAFWGAIAAWQKKDRRFARMLKLHTGRRIDLLRSGMEYFLNRHGEDERFQGGPLRVPANVLRYRASDVLSTEDLIKRHRTYRNRVMMGPSYRADMWSALDTEPTISAAQLARKTYGSFATASQVKHEWKLLSGIEEKKFSGEVKTN